MGASFYICFYHDKRTFRSSHQAYRELKKLNSTDDDVREGLEAFRVFFCDRTGGYHHTHITQAEMNRRQAAQEGGEGLKGHKKLEGQRRRQQRNPIQSPKRSGENREDRIRG